MIEVLQSIPAKLRQRVYFGYVILAFVLGGIHVAMQAAGLGADPTWFVVTTEVLKYASVPILAVAGVNVTASSEPKPAPDWPEDEVDDVGGGLGNGPVAEDGHPPLG